MSVLQELVTYLQAMSFLLQFFCAVHINVLSLLFGRYEDILPAKICFSLVKSFIRSEQNYYNVTLTQPKQISYIIVSVADLWLSSGLTSAIGHQ